MKQPPAISPAPIHAATPVPASHGQDARRVIHSCSVAMACVLLTGIAGIAGCAARSGIRPLITDRPVVLDGRVASVDKTPMAYDGDALVVVTTKAHGAVTVHLAARRNLCQAQGLDLLEVLKPGDRLQVEGTATGPADISVCQGASHRLTRLP